MITVELIVTRFDVFQQLTNQIERELRVSFPTLMETLKDDGAVKLNFRLLFRLQMPADDDVDDIREMRLEVSMVVLSDHHEHLRDGDECFSDIGLLEKVATRKIVKLMSKLKFCSVTHSNSMSLAICSVNSHI